MYSSIAAFALAFVLALALTPVVRAIARRAGAVDAPDERRVNAAAIPRMGGIAVFLAFLLPLVGLFFLETSAAEILFSHPLRMVGLGVGGLMVCALGAYDDVKGVRARHKLAIQVAAATLAYVCGFRIDAVEVPLLGVLDMGAFALPITVLWIVGVVNALNIIDGLDGLAAGIALFAAISNFLVGYLTNNGLVMLTSAALGGGVLGFLRYNFNPATIFMGDSGSMFLGFVLATSSLLGASVKSSTTVAILVPVLAMGVPITDMLLSILRRYLERRPIFAPDRGHIHHRLLDSGVTHRRAVLALYFVSVLGCLAAIGLAAGRNWDVGGALLLITIAVAALFLFMRYFNQVRRRARGHRAREFARTTTQLRQAVPEALSRLASVRTMDELHEALVAFAGRAEMRACSLSAPGLPATDGVAWAAENGAGGRRDVYPVRAEYPLDALPGGTLRFTLESPETAVLAQDEILLQLVVDLVDQKVSGLVEPQRRAASTPNRRGEDNSIARAVSGELATRGT